MEILKILFLVFHFPPISGGGVVVIVNIANTLAELGHDVTIITPNLEWNGEKYEPEINSKISVNRVDVPSNSNLKIAARRCYKKIQQKSIEVGKKEKFDFILSIFHPFHLVPKAAVYSANKLNIPSIIKIDDAIFEKASGIKSIQRKIEKIYNSKTLQKASRILVSNDETKEVVSNYYKVDQKKISIVPNGVELTKFYSKNVKKKIVIFSGAMYHHRGIDILLESIPKVISKIPDVKFQLLGDGPEKQKLEKIVEDMNISKNVEFKGWIDREKIPDYLSESMIGIGPLRLTTVTKNALPIKILEYMASGLPIISWNDTLPSDVLQEGKNGYFINSVKELSEKIVFLIENESKLLEFGEASKKMVSKFDWKDIVKKIILEYEKIKPIS